MAAHAGAKPVEQWGHWVQQQPLPTIPEHAYIVEHRSEEDAEGQNDFDNVLHVAEEKAGGGHDHTNPHAKHDHGGD